MAKISKKLIILSSIAGTLTLTGCMTVTELIAKGMTKKTSDLSNAKIQLTYFRNQYPVETKTTAIDYSKNLWKEGENSVSATLFKKEGFGMIDLDGTFTFNNEKPDFAFLSSRTKFQTTPTVTQVNITSKKGQTFKTSIAPLPAIKIISINGQTNNAAIDLTKDLNLKLQNPAGTNNTYIKLSLLADLAGTREFYPIGLFKSTDNLHIPAVVFPHSPTFTTRLLFNFNTGKNYLMVERFSEKVALENGMLIKKVSRSLDTKAVTVSNRIDSIKSVSVEGKVAKNMKYTVGLGNASFTKPFAFAKGKKFALASLTVNGNLQDSKTTSSTSSSWDGKTKTTTTTSQTWQFPKFSDAHWNSYMNDMYAQIRTTLTTKYGIKWVPVSKVVNADAYKNIKPYKEENSFKLISKSLRGTKNLYPSSFSATWKNAKKSSGFKTQDPKIDLMEELGVDGLVNVTIDLTMPRSTHLTLAPKVGFKIISKGTNGIPHLHQEDFFSGTISTGSGKPFNKSAFTDPLALSKIARTKDVIHAFSVALDKVEAKEKEMGYFETWKLK